MRTTLLVSVLLVLVTTGCARFRTVQTDTRYHADGTISTDITTKATAYTLFSSRQLATWIAQQTEKSQGASVGVDQQGATNTAAVVGAVVEAAIKAAVK